MTMKVFQMLYKKIVTRCLLCSIVLFFTLSSQMFGAPKIQGNESFLILLKDGNYLLADMKPIKEQDSIIFVQAGTKRRLKSNAVVSIYRSLNPFEDRKATASPGETPKSMPRKEEVKSRQAPLILTEETYQRPESRVYRYGGIEIRIDNISHKQGWRSHKAIIEITCTNNSDKTLRNIILKTSWFNTHTNTKFKRSVTAAFSVKEWPPGMSRKTTVSREFSDTISYDDVAFDLFIRHGKISFQHPINYVLLDSKIPVN